MKKTPLLSLFTFHLLLAILLIDGRAQDPFGDAPPAGDIFGGDTNPNPNAIPTNPTPTTFDNPTTTKPSSTKQLPPTSHPAILAIRERPPSTPAEIARAILYLSRLQQWEELSIYMEEWTKAPLTPAAASQMVAEVGLDSWIAIRRASTPLPAAMKTWMDQVIRKSSEAALDASILESYYRLLKSESAVDRKRGRMGLESAGPAGIEYFFQAVMNDTKMPSLAMSETLIVFGSSGREAWQAAVVTKDPSKLERIIGLVAAANARDYIVELVSLLFAEEATEKTKSIASQMIQRDLGSMPSAVQGIQYIQNKLEKQLGLLSGIQAQSLPLTREVWQWSADGKLSSTISDEIHAALVRAGQLAVGVARLSKEAQLDSSDAAATLLQWDYQKLRLNFVDNPMGGLQGWIPESISSDNAYLSRVLESAKKHDLSAAQLRCIQQIRKNGTKSGELPTSILQQLVHSLDSGDPSIRYAAGEALASQQDIQPFAGSNRAFENWMEMLALQGEPLTLIVGKDEGLRDHVAQMLQQLGHRSESAETAREALLSMESPKPLESILLIDFTYDMSLTQLVQRIRSHRRGNNVPIGVLIETTEVQQKVMGERGLVRSFVPRNVAGMLDIIKQLESVSGNLKLTPEDRIGWRTVAEDFVRTVATNREYQQTFPVAKWSRVIQSHLGDSSLPNATIDQLVDMGTRESQKELLMRSITTKAPMKTRQNASQGMVQSLAKHGLKLPVEETQLVYDAYNQQGREDIEARRLLGTLLDALEGKPLNKR